MPVTSHVYTDGLGYFLRGEALKAAWGKVDSNDLAFFDRRDVLAYIVQESLLPTSTTQELDATSTSTATLTLAPIFTYTVELDATSTSTATVTLGLALSQAISTTSSSTATLDPHQSHYSLSLTTSSTSTATLVTHQSVFSASLTATSASTASLAAIIVLGATLSTTSTSTATLNAVKVRLVALTVTSTSTASLAVRALNIHLSGTAHFGIDMAGNKQAAVTDLVEYALNETSGIVAQDALGVYNGAYHGAPTLGAPGVQASDGRLFISGYSVRLDGVNDYVDISPALALFTARSQVTIYGYFRVAPPTSGASSLLDVSG